MMSYEPTPKQALLIWRLITAETAAEREPMVSETRPELSPRERQALEAHGFVELEPRGRGKYYVLTDKAWAWAADASDVEILKSESIAGAEALQGLLRRLLPFLKQHELPLAGIFASPPKADSSPKLSAEKPRTRAQQASHSRGTNKKRSKTAAPKKKQNRSSKTAAPKKKQNRSTKPAAAPKKKQGRSSKPAASKKEHGGRRKEGRVQVASKVNASDSKRHERAQEPAPQGTLVNEIERACLALTGGARKQRVRLSALRRELGTVKRHALDTALLALQDQGRLVLYRDDNTAALTKDDHGAALIVGDAPRHLVYLEA